MVNEKKIKNADEYFEAEDLEQSDNEVKKDPIANEPIKTKDYTEIEDEEYSSKASYSRIIKYNVEE